MSEGLTIERGNRRSTGWNRSVIDGDAIRLRTVAESTGSLMTFGKGDSAQLESNGPDRRFEVVRILLAFAAKFSGDAGGDHSHMRGREQAGI